MAGIFVLEGMTFAIPKFTISMADDGTVSSDITVELRYDACLAWAGIALDHLVQLKGRLADRQAAWSAGEDDPRRGPTLEAEFRSAMQAIVAAATSVDALYDIVRGHAQIPPETIARWSKNRTARHKQVSETLRSAFKIKPDQAKALSQALRAIYKLRDAAVHPSGASHPPVSHPELDVATEWRLVAFRADVADTIVCVVAGMLWDLSHGTKYRSEGLTKYMSYCRTRLEALLPDGRPSLRPTSLLASTSRRRPEPLPRAHCQSP